MMRKWHKAVGALALGLVLAAPVSGCAGRPAPRPEPKTANPAGGIDPTLSNAVTTTAAGYWGAGTVAAIVKGNVALVAMQLNSIQPGGTEGGPLTGKAHDVDYPGSSPSGGPTYLQGPGGSVGASPARPGGQIIPGGATPGGSPNYTQAVPNAAGMNQTQGMTTTTPAPSGSSVGAAPMDVMTRLADHIRAKHPGIVEVRYATTPDEARRVSEIAQALQSGGPVSQHSAEIDALLAKAVPAGTTEFRPSTPPAGTRS
ncbi:MAG TPA: hypothetical protein VK464_16085 [Symbiobacteriaceae bacterium]|nr:hypothetical protein [Symbiobacteriaceae bacterium]